MNFEEIFNKDYTVITAKIPGTDAATASNYGKFFIAHKPYEIMEVSEVHATAGSDASAVTLNIERLQGTEALDSGDTVLVSAFNLKSTANTVVFKKTTALQNRTLYIGDRLALKDAGTLTAVNDVVITIILKPLGKGDYR